MRSIAILSISILMSAGCVQTAHNKITRHTINAWEEDIGYSAVVQSGDTYHISGVTCGGQNYQAAVTVCYEELTKLLSRYQLTSRNVVKENIYALDIEALQQQIPIRKKFYVDGQFPAATWVQVTRLYGPDHLIEIELTAVK